jgi:thioredoxin reductase
MDSTEINTETCTVAIVGGGTSGLALATELKRLGVDKVVVLEREAEAGGVPRHCNHYPFGVREYGRLLKGPDYARRNREAAAKAGVDIRSGATVTRLCPNGRLKVSTSQGNTVLIGERVVLCTGVRESSRAQRFISGDRPNGIFSTGALQSMVHLKGVKPFQRPIILGSELASFSAIQTCKHLGIKPVAIVEERDQIIARGILSAYPLLARVPLYTGANNPYIIGREHVEALQFIDRNGETKQIETDGIIISGHFRPESALMRSSHIEVDPGTGGPVIDQFGRCSDPVYFSAGNVLRPAETSSFCWHEGVDAARRIVQDLNRSKTTATDFVRLLPSDPALKFIVPQRLCITGETGGMDQMYVGLNKQVNGRLIACSNEKTIWRGSLNSRPVRRIQLPIDDILNAKPSRPVEFWRT